MNTELMSVNDIVSTQKYFINFRWVCRWLIQNKLPRKFKVLINKERKTQKTLEGNDPVNALCNHLPNPLSSSICYVQAAVNKDIRQAFVQCFEKNQNFW